MNSKSRLPDNTKVRQYIILGQLGKGGFGVTYKVVDENTGIVYAMKEYFPTDLCERGSSGGITALDDKLKEYFKFGLKRFHREAEILIGLQHRNIVKAKEYFDMNGTSYFVMDYLDGEDLQSYLKDKGSISQEEAFSIIMPILEALKKVHSYNKIHRDIKPGNIFMMKDGSSYHPVLIDFGAVKVFDNDKVREQSVYAVYTEGYAPPEQYNATKEINFTTDIYAIGAILYEFITEKRLKASPSRMADGGLEALSLIDYTHYDKNFLAATRKAIELRISDRPKDIETFQKYLIGEKTIDSGFSIKNQISNIQDILIPKKTTDSSDSVLISIMKNKEVWSKNKILLSLFTFIFVAALVLFSNGNEGVVTFLVIAALILGSLIYTNSTAKNYRLVPKNYNLPVINIKLNEELKVGRSSECTINLESITAIDTSFISNVHLQLYATHSGLYVKDIGTDGKGSRNGTYINSQKLSVNSRIKLRMGDRLYIANSDVCYELA